MAQPQIPIQLGGNLPGLESGKDVEQEQLQDEEMAHYEDVLGLDPSEVEEEIGRAHV